jgi:hypothetical protein
MARAGRRSARGCLASWASRSTVPHRPRAGDAAER